MANKDNLNNPSELAQSQAINRIKDLDEELAKEKNNTEPGVIGKIMNAFKEHFLNLGKPTMKKRKVHPEGSPQSSAINKTMKEVVDDINVIADEEDRISDAMSKTFNHSVSERDRLQNKLARLTSLVNDYVIINENANHMKILVSDSFDDMDKTDQSSSAHISTEYGEVTLGHSGYVDYTRKVAEEYNSKEEITEEEIKSVVNVQPSKENKGGWEGNWGVIYKPDEEEKDSMSTTTEGKKSEKKDWAMAYFTDPHINPLSVLDGNPDTWFEFHKINVPAKHKKSSSETKGYGWHFDDGEPMYYGKKTNDPLEASVTIDLGKERVINKIVYNPYNPGNMIIADDIETSADGAKFVRVGQAEDIRTEITKDTQVAPAGMTGREDYKGKGVWTFAPRPARYIRIRLKVEDPYTLKVGHVYFKRVGTRTTEKKYVFGLFSSTSTKKIDERIKGVDWNKDKMTSKGMWESVIAGAAVGAGVGGWLGAAVGAIVGLLCSSTTVTEDTEVKGPFVEDFPGWRYCIGIRDIQALSFEYQQSSTYISQPHKLPKPAKTISLEAVEDIPEHFYKDQLSKKNDFIRYYISVDGGNSWKPISPLTHTPVDDDFPPQTYIINSGESEDTRSPHRGYIDIDEEAREILFKAELSRPTEGDNIAAYTPSLLEYRLLIVPKEDA